ncbi:hypothetical protein DL96DRAFT_1628005 [Flagelloscypha sp. PMI_526]|nr:hypothetical protein DL96DRAFT_1628005 [Flagelloscypha sp. PMI_526]
MISFRTMLSVLSAFFFLFLSLTPGANAYRIPSRQTDGDQPLGFYMGFSESGGYFPIISGMNHLMVGDKDDDGSRKPRRNCIFYVNQRPPMNENDPNWAKKRALQFSELMNLAAAGGDYHTLYDVFNLEDAFNAAHPGPMSEALEAGLKRAWFQTTSEAYARLCEGTVYLVTD